MAGKGAVDSREYGLEFGLLFTNQFLATDHLHYGLWDEGRAVCLQNLPRAQERYVQALIASIPEGVRRILDVGAGSGALADRLLAEGYQVDCVSPSEVLTRHARDKLGDCARVFHGKFEALDLPGGYDLVLFSESFQYIPQKAALERARQLLAPGGRILICDFFRRETEERGPLKGGHRYSRFGPACAEAGVAVERDEDITDAIAPTMDVFDQLAVNFLKPAWELGGDLLPRRFPLLSRMGRWVFKKRLAKVERKYFSRERNGASFRHYKTYRRILVAPVAAGA